MSDEVQVRLARAIHRGDQAEAALRDAMAEMTAGMNDAQSAYLRERVDQLHAALEASDISPDHYGEAAKHLWAKFGPAIERELEARA
jgi:hypothetical protein